MARPKQKYNKRPQTADRRAIVILGMHRSGTSALGGALQLLGVDFGQRLVPPGVGNEKGYWEHPEILDLHDKLLSSLGSRWDHNKPLPSDWIKRKITRKVRSFLIRIVQRDFEHTPLLGLKDPRMCRLMPLWLSIFRTLDIEPHFVLVLRHPWEVAESLAERDGIDHPKSYLLWLEHVVQAEIATRSHKRSFVRYEEMVDDPVATLGELREQLGGNLQPPSEIRSSLQQFLDPSLRHHQFDGEKNYRSGERVPQLALDFCETIRKASTSREVTTKLEALAAQFIQGRELFYPRIIRTKKLSRDKVSKISLEVSDVPREVHVSDLFWLEAKVTNGTDETLFSLSPYPVRLAYHWLEKTTRQMAVFEGIRSRLSGGLDPNISTPYPMKIIAPDQPGEYILQTTIVQEGVRWFEDIRPSVVQEFAVSVIAGVNH